MAAVIMQSCSEFPLRSRRNMLAGEVLSWLLAVATRCFIHTLLSLRMDDTCLAGACTRTLTVVRCTLCRHAAACRAYTALSDGGVPHPSVFGDEGMP